ncbi:HAUS augmin-like complex subunit 6 isoform X2 [Syngnathus scovelli]|uniref:HAUS augmin-like complex subunit 6 isoform X2 n=1 Tax=Syngnathus scovelli TaxID=161590 RepID=UPI00210F6038|nr:HAUS augmin-like complex subunit 6 isoform X2 [Syngnathus scovelli]
MASQMLKDCGTNLWFCLLALGFEPERQLQLFARDSKYIKLGADMFDKANKYAFLIVVQFLLQTLDPPRFQKAFKFCWPPYNAKQDAEFRKETLAWLQEIMVESGFVGPKVLASWLVSPGGPKFIGLMVHLVKHVMRREMKTYTKDESRVADVVFEPTSSRHMALRRCRVARKKFLEQVAHHGRFFLDLQKKVQSQADTMRDLRAQSQKQNGGESVREDFADKAQMVARLWATVDGMLAMTEAEREVLESVLGGEVDRYALAGRPLRVSRGLLERPSRRLSSGTADEAAQLNLLRLLELMNHRLHLLREEPCGGSSSSPPLSLPRLQQIQRQMARQLQNSKLLRVKISQEEIPKMRGAVGELEAALDSKWAGVLKGKSLVSLLDGDPVLALLSPTARLPFEAARDQSDASCVFSKFPAKLPDGCAESSGRQVSGDLSQLKSAPRPAAEDQGAFGLADSTGLDSSLDRLVDGKTPAGRPQFADTVSASSPTRDGEAGSDPGAMRGCFRRDPFASREQRPRTPETLIVDTESSRRQALREDDGDSDGGVLPWHTTSSGQRQLFWGSFLQQETLPSYDSLLSLDDDAEEEEPCPNAADETPAEACRDGSPERPRPAHDVLVAPALLPSPLISFSP